jgi:hypothetical protein
MTTRQFITFKLEDLEASDVIEFEWEERKITAYVAHPPSPVKNEPGLMWITIGPLCPFTGANINNLKHDMEPLKVLKLSAQTAVRKSRNHLRHWVLGY